MRFNCTSCGECCKRLGQLLDHYAFSKDNVLNTPGKILRIIAAGFPYTPDKNGWCPKLKDNHCSVYKDRPLLCNFKKIYEKHPGVAETELLWYMQNMNVCNHFMEQAETPPSMRLKEPCKFD